VEVGQPHLIRPAAQPARAAAPPHRCTETRQAAALARRGLELRGRGAGRAQCDRLARTRGLLLRSRLRSAPLRRCPRARGRGGGRAHADRRGAAPEPKPTTPSTTLRAIPANEPTNDTINNTTKNPPHAPPSRCPAPSNPGTRGGAGAATGVGGARATVPGAQQDRPPDHRPPDGRGRGVHPSPAHHRAGRLPVPRRARTPRPPIGLGLTRAPRIPRRSTPRVLCSTQNRCRRSRPPCAASQPPMAPATMRRGVRRPAARQHQRGGDLTARRGAHGRGAGDGGGADGGALAVGGAGVDARAVRVFSRARQHRLRVRHIWVLRNLRSIPHDLVELANEICPLAHEMRPPSHMRRSTNSCEAPAPSLMRRSAGTPSASTTSRRSSRSAWR
jgi:hypothetical protein